MAEGSAGVGRRVMSRKLAFAAVLLLAEAVLVTAIINFVPYTKIDWDAYMSQVTGFLGGERDYMKLEGDTGPLVYPAGFLYVYSAIQYVTGGLVYPAQILFGILYVVNLGLIFFIYAKTNVGMSIKGVISALACAALVQIILGLPFLLSNPISYISRAFNLGRVFIHFWSVNFKFVPERIFVSKEFAITLLVAQLLLLLAFSHFKWCKHEGGIFKFLISRVRGMNLTKPTSRFVKSKSHQFQSCDVQILREDHVATLMFVGNFIGIVCARSLHYQFYSWYFYSLPFLLWKTEYPTPLRLVLFGAVELCWNVFPSNLYSSALLFSIHLVILWGLWVSPSEYPYLDRSSKSQKEE